MFQKNLKELSLEKRPVCWVQRRELKNKKPIFNKVAILIMKQSFENWKNRIDEIRERSLATKGRTAVFQLMVMTLFITSLAYITWYLFKIII